MNVGLGDFGPGSRDKLRDRPRYFETTIDQLLVGLLTEEDDVVLDSITTSLRQIVRSKPKESFPKLASTNRKLGLSLAKCLAK